LLPTSNKPPILIIGPPRSGTTLLATMLNSHPDIFMANEAKVFVRILPHNNNYPSPINERTAKSIIHRLETQELHYLQPLPEAKEILRENTNMDLAAFLRSLFETLAHREGKKRWGEKTAVAYRQLPLIRRCFPDALLIGLERNPYEIAASYMRINPKWGALGALVHWLDFRRAVARENFKEANIQMVSYEELISNPETVLRNVCAYVGEEYNITMLDYYKTNRAHSLSADRTYEGSAKPLYRSPEPPDNLRCGLTGYIIRRLIKTSELIDRHTDRRSFFFLMLKAWVYCRATLWEIKHKFLH